MKNYDVIMIGNTATVGYNLSTGLKNNGLNVLFIADSNNKWSKYHYGKPDKKIKWNFPIVGNVFKCDILHLHYPNLKKLLYVLCTDYKKLVCHWHGRDLKQGSRLIKKIFFRLADYHLYSTIDLPYYLRHVDKDKQEHFLNPVDTDRFKPLSVGKGRLLMDNEHKRNIKDEDMPRFYNQYSELEVTPRDNMSKRLVSVTSLEGAACGLKVLHHSYMDRDWILKNASIEVRSKRLLDIYKGLLPC